MSKNNDLKTGSLLDYEYFSNHYKLIAIDLSKQIELENPDLKRQMKKIEQQRFSSLKNQKRLPLIFHRILKISYKMEIQKIINLLDDSEESKFATKNGML